MGHRMFNSSQIFETANDQGWDHGDQQYMPLGAVPSDGNTHIHPMDNSMVQTGPFASHWTPPPRVDGYPAPTLPLQMPHCQPPASADSFLHQPNGGNFHVQENYSYTAPPSNYSSQTLPGVVDGSFLDPSPSNGRGLYKRKSPPMSEKGSTSRYYDVGTSTNLSVTWKGKQNVESYHTHPDYPPGYRSNNVFVGGEGNSRNVRSRTSETVHAPNNPMYHNHSVHSRIPDQSNPMDFSVQTSDALTREWSHNSPILPAGHGMAFPSDANIYSRDTHPVNAVTSHPSASLEMGRPHNVGHPNISQSSRGTRSGYSQRYDPTFVASSSNLCSEQMTSSDVGQQMVAENYPSRHPRTFSAIRPHTIGRNRRNLISGGRYRSFPEDASLHGRVPPEALVVADHPTSYGSRNPFDQHRELRLDIDNMSYEELLELGERIGNVNTGLSEASISKCMTESIYCSADDGAQEEGMCIICLEEYNNMDDIGALKACRHDFHVHCIRKWLSIKNLCPICKNSALDDSVKGK